MLNCASQEAMTVADKRLIKFIRFGGTNERSSRGRPEIDRPRLRELLINSLPDGMVKWDHRLRKVDADGSLHFDHGVVRGFDLVVGADGAWSKVRPLLTDIQPYYSGVYGYYLSIPNAKERAPDIYQLVNRGSLFCYSDGRAVLSQQMGDGSINVGHYRTSEEPPRAYGKVDAAAAKQTIRAALNGWHPTLISITQDYMEGDVQLRPLYMLPVGTRWDHRPGLTLIGDAAHLMTPFAGEGVNLAFTDSMKLADAIISASQESDPNGVVLDRKMKGFEEDMFARATRYQNLTKLMMNCVLFEAGAPWSTIEQWVCGAVEDGVPWFLFPIVKWLVYAYFFFFKLLYKPKDV